jgi:hypothetical protein
MIYVFDSNTLIDLFKNFYRNRFPTLWEKFDDDVKEGKIISVREVQNEIDGYGDQLAVWTKSASRFFQKPSHEELLFVTDIFKIQHFQSLIREKERLQGRPVADPFVIAKAKVLDGYVVTQEADKQNAAKIPNVCKHFGVNCLNLEGFMEVEDWTF